MLCNSLSMLSPAEAQEETIEEKFTKFGQQMSEMSKTFAEKAKTTFSDIHSSDFAVSTKSWLEEQLEKLKTKFQEISQ